jgi:S1-C subfamily serine protease
MSTSEPGALAALSAELASAVERIAASLVYVDADRRRDSSGIAWDEHTIVTTDHALERDEDIEIVLPDGRRARAAITARDPSTDLALLHTDATLVPATRADAAALKVGNIVLAVGRDEDGKTTASMGVASALDGPWRTWRGGDIDRFIRPDLSLYPGLSGGALADTSGALLGLNTWGLSRRMALTVPNATIERVAAQLAQGGTFRRGYLGIALQPVRLPESLQSALGIRQEGAVIVVDVASDGPAEKAGVLIGDVLVNLGTQTLEDADDMQRALGNDSVGKSLPLRFVRAGEARDLTITVEERPSDD